MYIHLCKNLYTRNASYKFERALNHLNSAFIKSVIFCLKKDDYPFHLSIGNENLHPPYLLQVLFSMSDMCFSSMI